MLAALEEVYGWDLPRRAQRFLGKDGSQIVRELVLDSVGSQRCEAALERALDLYLNELGAACRAVPWPSSRDPELLRRLSGEPRVRLGLLTGNLERGARLKLEPPGFNRYFPFGAFGSDSADRYELPGIAVERARIHSGIGFTGKSIVVVGDSVHDVACGRSLGVRAIAVATGPTSADRLAAERPDALFSDFSDVDAAFQAILA